MQGNEKAMQYKARQGNAMLLNSEIHGIITDILISVIFPNYLINYKPSHEKTNNLISDQAQHKTALYNHTRWLEAGNFGFRK